MTNQKMLPFEAIRKTINLSRDEVFTNLSPDESDLYTKVLEGDKSSIREIQANKLGSKMYELYSFISSDYMEIKHLCSEIEESTPISIQNNSNGLFNLGAMGSAANVTQAAPVQASDVLDKIDEFFSNYKQTDFFKTEFIKLAVGSNNKDLICGLIDRNIFEVGSLNTIHYKIEGKVYSRGAYDIKTEPLINSLVESNKTVLMEILIEHPVGQEMFKAMAPELHYHAVRFAFDTKNTILLTGLLDTGVDVSKLKDPEYGTSIMCDFVYRVDDDNDIENLNMLVAKGADLTGRDLMNSTPHIIAARVGKLHAMKFLLAYNTEDFYTENYMKESVLTLAQSGPARRLEEQLVYDESLKRAQDKFEESYKVWEVQSRIASQQGKLPPKEPVAPKFKPRPEDYPIELITLVEEAWMRGDPEQYKKDQEAFVNTLPEGVFSLSFDSDI